MYFAPEEIALERCVPNIRAAKVLKSRGFHTAYDVAELVPRKYIDYRQIKDITTCQDGEYTCVRVLLKSVEKKRSKNGRDFLSFRTMQGTQKVTALLFQKVYLYDRYRTMEDAYVVISGQVNISPVYGYSMTDIDQIQPEAYYHPYIKRIYRKFSGISDYKLQEYIRSALSCVREPLEQDVIRRSNAPDYEQALRMLHYPQNPQEINLGQQRLLFNDLLYFNLMLEEGKNARTDSDCRFGMTERVRMFLSFLPFQLTKDQKAAIRAILSNASSGKRNNVLLQGDVGCGKTIVAVICMLCAAQAGFQSVLMAPRTVLARQHYEEIKGYAERFGTSCVFLHADMKAKEKQTALEAIKSGAASLIIGTHSCIAKDVEYANLGLMITDEEHLFGVDQKQAINEKSSAGVHLVSMSATPIPRTVATVLYGDKTILSIKTKPAGRKEIVTHQMEDRSQVFAFMESEVRQGHQCYVVCPAIQDNEEFDIVSIEEVEELYRNRFQDITGISVVNGKMKKTAIAKEMDKFVSGENKILISTTVIEVGVNVPTATVMVVEQADRFGLASLHQLRGRVGRSDLQSYCILLSNDRFNERLHVMEETNDGFKIAEADLQIRGTGDLIGTRQAGFDKYVAEMLEHKKMFQFTQKAALFCLQNGFGAGLKQLKTEPVQE